MGAVLEVLRLYVLWPFFDLLLFADDPTRLFYM